MTLEERMTHLEREVGRLAAQYSRLVSGESPLTASSARSQTLAQAFATLERAEAQIAQLNLQMNSQPENGTET